MVRARPESLSELVQVMKSTAVGGLSLDIRAGGTKLGWLRPGRGADAVVEMADLAGLVEHAHGDMTATAWAGTRWVDLQAELARRGQRLAVDPPVGSEAEATLGGVFAADDAGPGRLAYGSLRELVIGGTFVLPDGTVARSGGKVIKNVAGYDLCKLFCGSRGCLGVAASLTFRLHPICEAEASLRARVPEGEGARRALELVTGALTPTGLTVQDETLLVRFEGESAFVETQLQVAEAQLREVGLAAEAFHREASQSLWRASTERRRAGPGEVTLHVSTRPSRTGAILEHARQLTGAETTDLRITSDPRVGSSLLHIRAADLDALAQLITALRAYALELRGHLRLRDGTPELEARVDPFGPLPSAIEVMRAVKERLDPIGRCMPGRYLFT